MGESFTRLTISVPRALRQRMEAVRGRVVWSQVAARAFEARLAELDLADERLTLTKADVVRRLRAQQEADDVAEGRAAGRAWAARLAKPKELRRLAAYCDTCERDGLAWWDVDYPGWPAPFGAADHLVFAIRPEGKDDRDAPGQFWREVLGEDEGRVNDRYFLRGFGEGAAELWDGVKDEL